MVVIVHVRVQDPSNNTTEAKHAVHSDVYLTHGDLEAVVAVVERRNNDDALEVLGFHKEAAKICKG